MLKSKGFKKFIVLFVAFALLITVHPAIFIANASSGDVQRFESYNNPGYFIRHYNYAGRIDPNVSPIDDSRFIERPGLADPNYVSYESVNNPGYYLRHYDYKIRVDKNDGTSDFKGDATFKKVDGLANSAYTSLQSYNFPTRYIRHYNYQLQIDPISTDVEKADATFKIKADKNAVIEDEFTGSSLDTSKWNYNYKWGISHNYSALVRPEQVTTVDGKLHIEAIDAGQDIGYWSSSQNKWIAGYMDGSTWRPFHYWSGAVNTSGKAVFNAECYIEGKFKLPKGTGFWPAFWMASDTEPWPPEIDIYEYLGHEGNQIHTDIHRFDSSKSNNDAGSGIVTNLGFDPSAAFHTYAIDWGKNYINYYVDGKLIRSVTNQATIDNQKNMYIMINLGVGGWETEPDSSTIWPGVLECDYVKAYKY